MRTRRLAGAVTVLATVALAGCGLLDRVTHSNRPVQAPPTFSQYHLDGWEWDRVKRVVVLPFRSESKSPRAGEEVREAFVAEMQRAGRFEVIPAPADDRAFLAAEVRCGGRFDEVVLFDLAQAMNADVVIHGTVTDYLPYNSRPRLGLVLQAVGPQEAKVVASVDGLWDTTDPAVADRGEVYYRHRARPRPPWIRNHVIASDESFTAELWKESPHLFRRFVAREAVLTLLGLPVPGVIMGADGAGCSRVGCQPALAPGAPVAPAAGIVR